LLSQQQATDVVFEDKTEEDDSDDIWY
jgi:hypothetical protein